ncbi:MAG: M20/M25/M40 family metallo-hydrolase [Acidobacteria bacterium]|nr:M20/M25/M40 family metallo-hydrolase [Acidobacteriota bacterium]
MRFSLLLMAAGLAAPAELATEGERWWGHIKILADDNMEGRNTGSPAYLRAARYVAQEFERAGLRPGGTDGYQQNVRFRVRKIDESRSSLALVRAGQARPLKLGEHATIGLRIDPAAEVEAPLIFVGHGLRIPEARHDDFAGLDLRGKIVVTLSGGPKSLSGALKSHYQTERPKILGSMGAVGSIALSNPRSTDVPWARSSLARLMPSMDLEDTSFHDAPGQRISLAWNNAHAEMLFEGAPETFTSILAKADADQPLPKFDLKPLIRARQGVDRSSAESPNVIGVLPGVDPKLRHEVVVLSAHLDHVGVGEPINGDRIYNGAMDNASGIASLIEIARGYRESGRKPARSIAFVAVAGEEKGLQGSKYFAGKPSLAKNARMVANINFDMFLPLHELKSLHVMGLSESDLGTVLERIGPQHGVQIHGDPEPDRNLFIRSDQYSFIRQGVPALAFKFGFEKGSREEGVQKAWLKERYHAPSDDLAQPVDRQAAARFNRLLVALIDEVATAPQRPEWKPDSFFRRFARP